MTNTHATESRALSFLAAACYLISLALCGAAAYAFAHLTAATTAEALGRFRQPLLPF